MELDKYYLTNDGLVAIVSLAEDAENPIIGYGGIGSCCRDFAHLANIDLDFSEAKKKHGDRCIGIGYTSPANGFLQRRQRPKIVFCL